MNELSQFYYYLLCNSIVKNNKSARISFLCYNFRKTCCESPCPLLVGQITNYTFAVMARSLLSTLKPVTSLIHWTGHYCQFNFRHFSDDCMDISN